MIFQFRHFLLIKVMAICLLFPLIMGCGRIWSSVRMDLAQGPLVPELDATWAPQWNSIGGLWHLNEAAGSTTFVDSSGNNHDGTNGNGNSAEYVTAGVTGQLNSGIGITANDQFITISPSPDFGTNGALTISAWINPAIVAPNGSVTCYLRYGVFSDEVYALNIDSNGYIAYEYNDGSSYFTCSSNILLTLNHWQHVAMIRNAAGTGIQFFINGQPAGTCNVTAAQSATPTTFLIIGSFNQNSSGSIDEVALWPVALTPTEIQTIYLHQMHQVP